MKAKRGHLLRNVVIVTFAVLFSVAVVIATPPIFFFNVAVSGTASPGTHPGTPTHVTFVDENGLFYNATIRQGSYSINLQNGHNYLLYVVFAAGGELLSRLDQPQHPRLVPDAGHLLLSQTIFSISTLLFPNGAASSNPCFSNIDTVPNQVARAPVRLTG